MKKLIKNVLMETIENKKLQMAYVYLSNYMDSLEKFVDKGGGISFREWDNDYYNNTIVWVDKKSSTCWFAWPFLKEFSEKFSLELNECKSVIIKWVENTYKLTEFNLEIKVEYFRVN